MTYKRVASVTNKQNKQTRDKKSHLLSTATVLIRICFIKGVYIFQKRKNLSAQVAANLWPWKISISSSRV